MADVEKRRSSRTPGSRNTNSALRLIHTYRKNLGWLLLADVISIHKYNLCKSSLIFVPYFSFWGTISHTSKGEIPDSYDKCEPSFSKVQSRGYGCVVIDLKIMVD